MLGFGKVSKLDVVHQGGHWILVKGARYCSPNPSLDLLSDLLVDTENRCRAEPLDFSFPLAEISKQSTRPVMVTRSSARVALRRKATELKPSLRFSIQTSVVTG